MIGPIILALTRNRSPKYPHSHLASHLVWFNRSAPASLTTSNFSLQYQATHRLACLG